MLISITSLGPHVCVAHTYLEGEQMTYTGKSSDEKKYLSTNCMLGTLYTWFNLALTMKL